LSRRFHGAAARRFEIPLDFLPAGRNFRLELFRDDPSVATATHVAIDATVVNRESKLAQSVAARNGFAVILTPAGGS